MKRLPVLPASTLKEYPSIAICETKVLEHYKSLVGQTRGEAVVNYLSILESLPAYGQHYYEVKDKSGNPCWLTLSYRGISQYDRNDRSVPRRVFLWKQLENLYYRDRKFTVEVHEARRVVHTLSSFNLYEDAIEEPVEEFDDLSSAICDPTTQVSVSRRALAPASVTVYVWYAASPTIAKCIWSMAIAQHGFFIDRSNKKSRSCANRSLSQIATELCRSVQSLSSASSLSNISRSTSSASIPTIVIEGEISEESKAATIEMLTALQSRKDALQEALKKKTEELKALCLKEGEITGELPPETPFQPGEPQPHVRRRIGTSFTLSDKIICRAKGKDRETLNDLELDYEIQSKIASAALKLANEVTARKSVRKLRKISYQQATTKLKDIEQKLSTLKREKEAKKKPQDTSSEGTPDDNRTSSHLGLPSSSSENSIVDRNANSSLTGGSVPPSTSLPQLSETACSSAPPSPAKCRQRHQSLQHVPVITTEVYEDIGLPYNPHTRRNSSSYSAASEYDSVSYSGSGIGSLTGLYRNRFEANIDLDGTNHYSVPNRRASQAFNDPDELILDGNSNAVGQCCAEDVPSSIYVNSASLSSSYDERLFNKGDRFTLTAENASTADSYDKSSLGSNSILSFNDSSYQLNTNCDFSKQEKYLHSHSENSLHRQRANSLHHKIEHLHISEPELNLNDNACENNIPLGYNVPLLRKPLRPTSTILPANTSDYSSGVSNQSINQVIELGSASLYLQENKRTTASGCLEYSAPKPKTKEWIETSLDSPIVTRKKKHKPPDNLLPAEQSQQVPWLENGLPTVFPNDSYCGYQNQSKYEDINASNSIKFRKSPSPVQQQYTTVDCRPEYRNLKGAYPSQIPERIYVNSNPLVQDSSAYHDYENTPEIPRNLSKFTPRHSSPCYESMNRSYNSNYKNAHEELSNQQHLVPYEEAAPSPKLGVAEPQQPSKHQNRRINMGDVFPPDNLPCISVSDYQNIPVDNQYEPVNFREVNSTYPQIQCDVPISNQYSLNHSYNNESQTIYHDNFNNSSTDSSQVQTWQSPATPVPVETAAVSPVPQNINFSPSVEVNVVSVGHFQPYWEETKPYELSDFYKYSTKHRKQQKNSTSDSVDSQSYVEKENSECQYYEQSTRESTNVTYREFPYQSDGTHASIVTPPKQHQEFVTSHVPVFGCSEQLESPAQYYAENSVSSPAQQSDPDKSLSLGEVGLRISLADTFHDEMVTWYQNQDTVKKATLV